LAKIVLPDCIAVLSDASSAVWSTPPFGQTIEFAVRSVVFAPVAVAAAT
jgi:hypothetical protein